MKPAASLISTSLVGPCGFERFRRPMLLAEILSFYCSNGVISNSGTPLSQWFVIGYPTFEDKPKSQCWLHTTFTSYSYTISYPYGYPIWIHMLFFFEIGNLWYIYIYIYTWMLVQIGYPNSWMVTTKDRFISVVPQVFNFDPQPYMYICVCMIDVIVHQMELNRQF